MTVRRMTFTELETVLGWAAAEGWNPGSDDAVAFWAADPAGFFVKEVDQRPVAAISVVNHDAQNAFLGLYICHPDFRGRGYGREVWQRGKDHAGTRTIGLDGVAAQQENYAKDGFVLTGRTVRLMGAMETAGESSVTDAGADDMPDLLAMDLRATGHLRDAFLRTWFLPGPTRKTLVVQRAGGVAAFATCRKCREGTKIGPLCAESWADAEALMAQAASWGAAPLFIDVPASALDFHAALKTLHFEPVFETARMYRGALPIASPPPFYGIATMELG